MGLDDLGAVWVLTPGLPRDLSWANWQRQKSRPDEGSPQAPWDDEHLGQRAGCAMVSRTAVIASISAGSCPAATSTP